MVIVISNYWRLISIKPIKVIGCVSTESSSCAIKTVDLKIRALVFLFYWIRHCSDGPPIDKLKDPRIVIWNNKTRPRLRESWILRL
jgi:hypothetical protein